MNTTSVIGARELDRRSNNGIEEVVRWNSRTDRVSSPLPTRAGSTSVDEQRDVALLNRARVTRPGRASPKAGRATRAPAYPCQAPGRPAAAAAATPVDVAGYRPRRARALDAADEVDAAKDHPPRQRLLRKPLAGRADRPGSHLPRRRAAWIHSRPCWSVRQVRFSMSLPARKIAEAHGWRMVRRGSGAVTAGPHEILRGAPRVR